MGGTFGLLTWKPAAGLLGFLSIVPTVGDLIRNSMNCARSFTSEATIHLNSNRTRKVAYGFLSTCRSLLGSGKIGPVRMVSVREICTTFGKTPICGNPASHFKRCERLFWK